MREYRLYRLQANGQIIDRLDIDVADDEEAIDEAIRIDHAYVTEIWVGQRFVTTVAPSGKRAESS